jgi:hypothetical protein
MKITVELSKEEATALLTFLRRVNAKDVSGFDWPVFDRACTVLRIALRDVVEPGWQNKED